MKFSALHLFFLLIIAKQLCAQNLSDYFSQIDDLIYKESFDGALQSLDSIYPFLQKDSIGYPEDVLLYYKYKSKCYTYTRLPVLAMAHAEKYALLAESLDKEDEYFQALSILATSSKNLGHLTKADSLHKLLIEYFSETKDSSKLASVLVNQANTIKRLNKQDEAIELLTQAERINKALNDEKQLTIVYANLCHLFQAINDNPQSILYGKRALAQYGKNEKNRITVLVAQYIGNAYKQMDSTDQAITYLSRAVLDMEAINYSTPIIAENKLYLGELYSKREQFELSNEAYNEAYNLAKKPTEDKLPQLYTLSMGIDRLIELKRKFPKANLPKDINEQLQEIKKTLNKVEDENAQMLYDKAMASWEELHGRYANALVHTNSYYNRKVAYEKALHDEDLEEWRIKYDTKNKEAALQKANIEKRNTERSLRFQKSLRMVFVGLIALLLGLIYFIFRSFKQQKEIGQLKFEESIKNKENHIASLKAQIGQLLNQGLELKLSTQQINTFIEDQLTKKEIEVLEALVQGKTNKEIAEEQFISVNTVKFHLKNIYNKLEVSNRKQVIKKVLDINK